MFDLLLTNGSIVDGSGSPRYMGNVGIKDGKIVDVGPNVSGESIITLNVMDCCISPGFIDAHTHDDLALLNDPDNSPKLLQGVTTVVLGNCGHGCAPVGEDITLSQKYSEPVLGRFAGRWDWKRFDEYVERLVRTPKALNSVCQVAHGSIRSAVMGFEARPATPMEIRAMAAIVEEAFQSGAVGLSLGLMYAPGCYADKHELQALAQVVARHNGILNCHLRTEGDYLKEAMEEFFEVGRTAGANVHVSHLKSIGRRNHGRLPQIIEWLDDLRARGEGITCDVYPYPAGSTTITSLMPPWAMEGGVQLLLNRLGSKSEREKVKADLGRSWGKLENHVMGTGYDRIMVCGFQTANNQVYEGQWLSEVAEARKVDADECLLQLIEEEKGALSIILFQMKESDVVAALKWPWAMIGSDGLPLSNRIVHPRQYGTFPRVLSKFVRGDGILPLEEAVRKMTELPASRFKLDHRGRVLTDYVADLVVFSADRVKDLATFENPRQHPEGIEAVVVNGRLVARSGIVTGLRPAQHIIC